jgi:heme/copper-type cytochrome/quinol oxidase subunit 3
MTVFGRGQHDAVPAGYAHAPANRPNMVSIGTIVWLSSELMFFAALFAMYFTLRAVNPEVWAADTQLAEHSLRQRQHHDPGALQRHLSARRLRR